MHKGCANHHFQKTGSRVECPRLATACVQAESGNNTRHWG